MISKELLEILACPETKAPLRQAEADLLRQLNELIEQGSLANQNGDVVVDPFEEGLVREDGAVIYPVRDGIPILLIGEGVPLQGAEE